MAQTKKSEAIIFIHGSEKKAKGEKLKEVCEGIRDHNYVARVDISDSCYLSGYPGKRLRVNYDDGEYRVIDVYEAYWSNYLEPFDHLKFRRKPIEGLRILFFWMRPRIFRFAKGDLSKGAFMVGSSLMLTLWYLLLLATTISILATIENSDKVMSSYLSIDSLNEGVTDFLNYMHGFFKYLVGLSAFAALLPLGAMADVAFNSRKYLVSEPYRNNIRGEVHKLFFDVIDSEKYDKITLLSHSFGSAVAVHYLSTLKSDLSNHKVRFISLGASVSFLSLRSDWLQKAIKDCFRLSFIDEWVDFYSKEDWLCSSVKLQDANG